VLTAWLTAKTGAVRYTSVPLAEQFRRSLASWTAQLPKPKPKPVVRHAGAVALLDDLLPDQLPEEINPPQPRPSWSGEQRLAELGAESEAIQEAIKLLQPELAKARREYSKMVATQRGGEFSEIVSRVVDASRGLGDAILAHHEFITEQRIAGVGYQQFRPLNLSAFGSLSEQHTPLLAVILDAIEKKHVDGGKLPSWKMPAPIEYFNGGN
jgi:hypothetical protein